MTTRRKRSPSPEEPALSRQAKGRGGQGVRTDDRLWPLLQRYAKLAKVKLIPRGADLYEMKLPLYERTHFSGRATVRLKRGTSPTGWRDAVGAEATLAVAPMAAMHSVPCGPWQARTAPSSRTRR